MKNNILFSPKKIKIPNIIPTFFYDPELRSIRIKDINNKADQKEEF